jgi:tetratricopeptide (TPR) repeat protein
MNSLLPLVYSSVLFTSLIFLGVYFVGQVQITQRVEKRLSSLEKKLKNNSYCSESFYKLGQLYLRKKIYIKAITLFKSALKNWDINDKIGLGSLYNSIGFTYFKMQNYKQAIYYYTEAITILPDYILALNNLGFAYENNKQYKKAWNTYSNVLNYDVQNKIALSRKKLVYSKLILT